MLIRPVAADDLPALHAINQASTPGVSAETPGDLARWIALGRCLAAQGERGAPLGFLNLIDQGREGYPSPNLAWFEARRAAGDGAGFVYVDRIALAPGARGRGIGQALYRAAFAAWAGRRAAMVCEVNTRPPNPGSLRFHERLGFARVGGQAIEPGAYEVAYLERRLEDHIRP